MLLDVVLQPGSVQPSPGQPLPPTSFVQGKQVRFVLLDKPDGAWSVDGLSTTPATFASTSPTPDDLAKTQQLQGTLVDFNFRPFDDATGINRILDFMTLKVDKNMTTSGGTFKPGDVVRIDMNQIVPTQGQGHFELTKGERLVAIVQQADPRYNLGETVWYCKDLNHLAYESNGKFYNWLGYAVDPLHPLQPLQPVQTNH